MTLTHLHLIMVQHNLLCMPRAKWNGKDTQVNKGYATGIQAKFELVKLEQSHQWLTTSVRIPEMTQWPGVFPASLRVFTKVPKFNIVTWSSTYSHLWESYSAMQFWLPTTLRKTDWTGSLTYGSLSQKGVQSEKFLGAQFQILPWKC